MLFSRCRGNERDIFEIALDGTSLFRGSCIDVIKSRLRKNLKAPALGRIMPFLKEGEINNLMVNFEKKKLFGQEGLKKNNLREDFYFVSLHRHFFSLRDLLSQTPLSLFSLSWRPVLVVERTTDHGQATGTRYHLRLRVECTLFCNLQFGREPTPYW